MGNRPSTIAAAKTIFLSIGFEIFFFFQSGEQEIASIIRLIKLFIASLETSKIAIKSLF